MQKNHLKEDKKTPFESNVIKKGTNNFYLTLLTPFSVL